MIQEDLDFGKFYRIFGLKAPQKGSEPATKDYVDSLAPRLVSTALRGDTGETGPQGEQGLPGTPGKPGDRGPAGMPGRNGQDGKDGLQGSIGAPGRDGLDGKYIYLRMI